MLNAQTVIHYVINFCPNNKFIAHLHILHNYVVNSRVSVPQYKSANSMLWELQADTKVPIDWEIPDHPHPKRQLTGNFIYRG